MPPPPAAMGGEPTVFQKLKMGAMTGSLVGLTIGFLFGSFAILRNGAGPRGFLPSLSGYMLSSAATFGFFMSIGTVIRTEDYNPRLLVAPHYAHASSSAVLEHLQRARTARLAEEDEEPRL